MKEKQFLIDVSNDPFLRNFIRSLEVLHFIACQFALESNFGKSDLARKYNNFCGMKYPHRRFTFASSRVGEFSVYEFYSDCVLDYLMWIFYNRPYQNSLEHLDSFKLFLRDSGYCPEKDYISRIETLYNQYFVSPQN